MDIYIFYWYYDFCLPNNFDLIHFYLYIAVILGSIYARKRNFLRASSPLFNHGYLDKTGEVGATFSIIYYDMLVCYYFFQHLMQEIRE